MRKHTHTYSVHIGKTRNAKENTFILHNEQNTKVKEKMRKEKIKREKGKSNNVRQQNNTAVAAAKDKHTHTLTYAYNYTLARKTKKRVFKRSGVSVSRSLDAI